MAGLPVKKGINPNIVGSIPEEWNPVWFRRFISTHLNMADVRSSTAAPGVTLSATPATTALISTVSGTNGISVGPSGFSVVAADHSISVISAGIKVQPSDASLVTGGSGIGVQKADASLTTTGSGLEVQKADASLKTTGSGIAVQPHLGITTDGSGLSAGTIDPSQTPSTIVQPGQGILAKGNVMPFVQSATFTYTSDTADVTYAWTGYTVYRPDGTTFALTAGSQAVSGLSASTTYIAYAYSTEAAPSTVLFVTGLSGQVGTPAIVFPPSATFAQKAAALAQAFLLSNIFLGKVTAATVASGTGSGNAGGGGMTSLLI